MIKGKVWLVGAGPSDPGLLTIKAKRVIQNADVVLYDRLVSRAVLELIPCNKEKIDVGKRAGFHPIKQDEINNILLREAQKGRNVVRLKGGDPFVFGRGGEELELLYKNQIDFEVVPGVTSALAVPAYSGIPVTHRGYASSIHIITGHGESNEYPNINFRALVQTNGTLVFLMGVSRLEYICSNLIVAGLDPNTPAAIIEKGTTSMQRTIMQSLGNLPQKAKEEKIETPAIIIVGKVCELAPKFLWAEKRELAGARVIITRAKESSPKLKEKLEALGADVVELASIKTEEIIDNYKFKSAISNINKYSWLVFTSAVGVKIFFKELINNKIDVRNFVGIKIAVIGSSTAKELEQRGIIIDYMPKTFESKSLSKGLNLIIKKEDYVLIARAEGGSNELPLMLKAKGAKFDDISIYKTVYEKFKDFELYKDDYIMFTSASTVKGFVNSMSEVDYSNLNAICIGEQTAKEARNYKMNVFNSQECTIDSMVECIKSMHKRRIKG